MPYIQNYQRRMLKSTEWKKRTKKKDWSPGQCHNKSMGIRLSCQQRTNNYLLHMPISLLASVIVDQPNTKKSSRKNLDGIVCKWLASMLDILIMVLGRRIGRMPPSILNFKVIPGSKGQKRSKSVFSGFLINNDLCR